MSRTPRTRLWLRRALMALLALAIAQGGLTLLLASRRMHRYLTARLASSFGRPVQVSNFRMSFLPVPRIQANYITVAEDSQFGQEYFLRAEQLSASVGWRALLLGRFEFGTLSFSRPSLNLVRLADGRWNLEGWLPPPAGLPVGTVASATTPGAAGAAGSVPHLTRIDLDNGRINFRRGHDQHPFALVGVTGRIEQAAPGRWHLDLKASPTLSAVRLQDVGTIHAVGNVGGTSARLRPAEIELSWPDVSLSDALRLLRGSDFGVRGRLALELTARSQGAQWSFAARVRARNVHGWDLPLRPGNPPLNVRLAGDWWPQLARVDLAEAVVEAPQSSLRADGFIRWARPPGEPAAPARDEHLQVISAGVHLSDLLAWYRAFHSGVADGVAAEGLVGVDLSFQDWPPRVLRGALATEGARLRAPSWSGPLRVGRAIAEFRPGAVTLPQVAVAMPGQADSLRLNGKARRSSSWGFQVEVAGKLDRLQDLFSGAAAFGRPLPAQWNISGAAAIRLKWSGAIRPFAARAWGTIGLRQAEWRPLGGSAAVDLAEARIELRPGQQRITLSAAQVLGTTWKGRVWRDDSSAPWRFDLAAERLDVAEMGRWLGPARSSSPSEQAPAERNPLAPDLSWLSGLRAQGRLQVNRLLLTPLALDHLRATAELSGRQLELQRAQAEFYGGAVHGSFRALLAATPEYQATARLDRVDLSQLATASPALEGRFRGTASGELELTAQGRGRDELRKSLTGRGSVSVRNAEDRSLDWIDFLATAERRTGSTLFRSAAADFRLADGKIVFGRLRLLNTTAEIVGAGSVDFSHALDLRIRALAPGAGAAARPGDALPALTGRSFHLVGDLEAPEIAAWISQSSSR